MSDANSVKYTKDIKDFCDCYGYGNENARDVIDTYNECELQLKKYNTLFTEKEQAEIENLLADY